jgi:hypothetical protein
MKSYRKELWFNIPSRRGFVNITPDVEVGATGWLGILQGGGSCCEHDDDGGDG